jgi:putative DNA primase/helicase
VSQDTYERAREALSFIPPEDRELWVRMAMAIKSEFGDPGFDLWDEWSRAAESYNAASAKSVWKGIKEAGRITIASLFYEARQHGWTPSGGYQPRELNDDERGERECRMREAEEERKQENARAREQGRLIYKNAGSPSSHVYLKERKHVEPTDTLRQIPQEIARRILGYDPQANEEKLVGNLLVAPLKAGADFVGVELIDGEGRKTVPFGTATKGAYWSPESLPDGDGDGRRVLIGEGVATMLSARAACPGDVCIAARFAGNLPSVAEAMRQHYPNARIVILGERGGGFRFAERAARACNGLLGDFVSDANDLHQAQGLEAVRVVIGAATEPPEETPQDAPQRAQRQPDISEAQPEGENAPQADSDGWREPEPLFGGGKPDPYPLDAWPGIAGAAIREVLEFAQCPPALAAHGALTAMSIVTQGLANVRRPGGLQGPISIYSLMLCESGERKSSVDEKFLAGIRAWESERFEADKLQVKQYLNDLDAWKATREGLLNKIKRASERGPQQEGKAK